MVIKYVISLPLFGQKTHTKLLKHGEVSWWGLQGVRVPLCLKEIIHDENRINNFIHSLVQTSPNTYKKKKKKKKRNQNKTKKQTNTK